MSEAEYITLTPAFQIIEIEGVIYCTTPNGKNDFGEEKASLLRLYTPLKSVVVKPKALPAPVEEPKAKRKKK